MIKVKNPLAEVNRRQEEYLSSCPQEDQRFFELMYCARNISDRFLRLAQRFKPSPKDYEQWLQTFHPVMRAVEREQGFEKALHNPVFRRYILKKNGMDGEDYIRLLMDKDDYSELCQITNGKY